MYLLEGRYGFMVSVIFVLLSIAVSAVRNTDMHETGSIAIAEMHRPVAIAEMHRSVCSPKQRLARRLGREETATPPPADEITSIPYPHSISKNKTNSTKDTVNEEKGRIIKALRLAGGVLSLVVLLLPFLCVWSSGNLANTLRLYSELDLGCTALSSYGWLPYSVVQASFKDYAEIKGIDAIIINGFSWGFVGFLLLVVLLCAWEAKGRVCLIGVAVHIVLTVGILQFPIFKWVGRKSTTKLVIGVLAGVFQNVAELIPMFRLVWRWSADAPEGGYPNVPNFKKFNIMFRAFDSIAAIYWMLYCVFTYEFDEFGISSIICGGLSLISLCAHVAWAVKPN